MTHGWICPKCGNCYAPDVRMCESCKPIERALDTQYTPDDSTCQRCGCTVILIDHSGTADVMRCAACGSTVRQHTVILKG